MIIENCRTKVRGIKPRQFSIPKIARLNTPGFSPRISTIFVIGVTGEYGAGKDTVAEVLGELGFEHISLSDFLREKLRSKGGKITRERMIATGDELRRREGADVLARKAFKA